MSTIEEQIAILNAPSPPAIEVVTMPRALAEQGLIALEQVGASSSTLLELRGLIAEPAQQLWAIHCVGPNEEYPCMDKEDAGRRAQDIRECGNQMKAERIARGESVELWSDWVTNVIPSPWEPAEHFEIMAQEWMDDADSLRQHAIQLQTERDELLEALKDLSDDIAERFDLESQSTNPGIKIYVEQARAAIAKATQPLNPA